LIRNDAQRTNARITDQISWSSENRVQVRTARDRPLE
jgi:hypothetical protein